MTVKELISMLQEHDPEMKIALRQYEGGYYFPEGIVEKELLLNVYEEWYNGRHQIVEDYYGESEYKYDREFVITIA